MLGNLTGWHALILLAVVLLIFGAAKLPALARSMGQSAKIFRNEIKSDEPSAASDGNPVAKSAATAASPKP